MNTEKLKTILLNLSSADGLSGEETDAVETAARYFRQYTGEVKNDRFGNLLALKPGYPASDQQRITLALVAHIDQIGAMVTKIEEGGFIRFAPVGSIDPRILPGHAVKVHGKNRLQGVVGAKAPHLTSQKERTTPPEIENMFIDLGCDEKKVREQVRVGDFIALEQPPLIMQDSKMITGKSLDNRAGAATMIASAASLSALRHQADVCFISTVQEEVGLRGAVSAAYGCKPDLAIVIDVTHGDAPGLEDKTVFKNGAGPAIAVGPNFHPILGKKLREIAQENYLPFQIEPISGPSGTDAWPIQVSREGIPTALLSIPLRYMHTAVELINLDDLIVSSKLLNHFMHNLDYSFLEELKNC